MKFLVNSEIGKKTVSLLLTQVRLGMETVQYNRYCEEMNYGKSYSNDYDF